MQTLTLESPKISEQNSDFLPLKGTDYIEFYVGNAKQAAHFYESVFGFEIVAYLGPETGVREKASYMVQQGKIRLVLTTSIYANSEISEHIHKHGDGVKVLALWVDDATASYHETIGRGAISVSEPQYVSDEQGYVIVSSIKT